VTRRGAIGSRDDDDDGSIADRGAAILTSR